MSQFDPLTLGASLGYIEELERKHQQDPGSVDPAWRALLDGSLVQQQKAPTNGNGNGNGHSPAVAFQKAVAAAAPALGAGAALDLAKAFGVWSLIREYRALGHYAADIDPLGLMVRPQIPSLEPSYWGLEAADLEKIYPVGDWGGQANLTVGQLLEQLRATYCGHIGVQYMDVRPAERRDWLVRRLESTQNQPQIERESRLVMLEQLAASEALERFIHTKYIGTKRFSLEGGETMIPMLDQVIERAAQLGVEEAVIGMPHRGRLNVLVQIMKKKPSQVFAEFEDIDPEQAMGGGDVKYHLGASCDHTTRLGKNVHLSLAFNPSHLEAVDPIVLGRVRAKQRRRHDEAREKVLGILLHGDAAFAGQGLVAETLNLSEIHGYRTGGTVHLVVNNQIGFTTTPSESRSTPYCTDIAKMLRCPVFHVNGEDPDAVAHVVRMAMDWRAAFKSDVVIDMVCFRKYGHNETDEPAFTQPLLYRAIEKKQHPFDVYAQRLIDEGVISRADVDAIVVKIGHRLEEELATAKKNGRRPVIESMAGVWRGYVGGADRAAPDVETKVPRARLEEITRRITTPPEGFTVHAKIARLLEQRLAMGTGQAPIDWGMGEMLAYGSLLQEGTLVRISGQDCGRGTFSHRHAILVDQNTGTEYSPLRHLSDKQAEFRVYDSPLSEAGVLGFEFGFSLDYPDGLVIWEAQFGDFVNGAQVILDQFVSSTEDKWKRLSGLTMFLPHGYEGQGPEHSSARFERFLQLCAEDNLQVVQPTTPAQMFHLLRRQVLRKIRKPLVAITPKSLLRLPAAMSSLEELAGGQFHRVLGDPAQGAPSGDAVERIFLCTGKIAYELAEERRKRGDTRTAILRLEQLYPWRDEEVLAAIERYPRAGELVYVQDEPWNMGALFFVEPRLRVIVGSRSLRCVSRVESASPATGSHKAHQIEQRQIMEQAFGG